MASPTSRAIPLTAAPGPRLLASVNAPAPIYHRNVLKNFIPFKLHASEYHRTYPYRATQWYFADGK